MTILNKIKYFLYQYSCFFVFGMILGTFNRSLTEVLTICTIFSLSVWLVNFKYENPEGFKENFLNIVFDNLYVIVFASIMSYVGADIIQTITAGFAVIGFTLLRIFTK